MKNSLLKRVIRSRPAPADNPGESMRLGEQIRLWRTEHNMTQNELAERLGVRGETVSAWERGTSRPQGKNLGHLQDLMGVSTVELLDHLDLLEHPQHVLGGLMQIAVEAMAALERIESKLDKLK